ncbi:tricarboxylic transporter [Pseudomonas sp. PA1(2017)]|uniref:Bug family tripartite tricarboxylate transporter substrate binding protein n=1 Tax=Pseudomonas sp. PA1(2017) TaxID=1932113 RepID=UPI00095EF954|nr:tripartite tricarboxylate transporter substrate binding protein [Pseudomonas sp. PA1(2017)]OLU17217.1 tricarboxylic transporter [Pseudomonas sp. PA1(2017)]
MKNRLTCAALLTSGLLAVGMTFAEPKRPECIAPAKPGGGFDITCKIAQSGLKESGLLKAPMRVTYMPGGIGAVAYNAVVAQRPKEPGVITAWSSGSLLNLAQGKFGSYDEKAVRWLAAIGTDYGAIIVRQDSPLKTLGDLIKQLENAPSELVIGAGGTVGSQDWMQAALIARSAHVDPQALRYVAFEGGGEPMTALLGGHVQAVVSGFGEATAQMNAGNVRILAVMAEERLPGKLADIPTAREQGYDVVWPIVRGFYMGPEVSDEDFTWWQERFETLLADQSFDKKREQFDLLPFFKTGDELEQFVYGQVAEYKNLADEFGLLR